MVLVFITAEKLAGCSSSIYGVEETLWFICAASQANVPNNLEYFENIWYITSWNKK